jgi:hypothetical protein
MLEQSPCSHPPRGAWARKPIERNSTARIGRYFDSEPDPGCRSCSPFFAPYSNSSSPHVTVAEIRRSSPCFLGSPDRQPTSTRATRVCQVGLQRRECDAVGDLAVCASPPRTRDHSSGRQQSTLLSLRSIHVLSDWHDELSVSCPFKSMDHSQGREGISIRSACVADFASGESLRYGRANALFVLAEKSGSTVSTAFRLWLLLTMHAERQ